MKYSKKYNSIALAICDSQSLNIMAYCLIHLDSINVESLSCLQDYTHYYALMAIEIIGADQIIVAQFGPWIGGRYPMTAMLNFNTKRVDFKGFGYAVPQTFTKGLFLPSGNVLYAVNDLQVNLNDGSGGLLQQVDNFLFGFILSSNGPSCQYSYGSITAYRTLSLITDIIDYESAPYSLTSYTPVSDFGFNHQNIIQRTLNYWALDQLVNECYETNSGNVSYIESKQVFNFAPFSNSLQQSRQLLYGIGQYQRWSLEYLTAQSACLINVEEAVYTYALYGDNGKRESYFLKLNPSNGILDMTPTNIALYRVIVVQSVQSNQSLAYYFTLIGINNKPPSIANVLQSEYAIVIGNEETFKVGLIVDPEGDPYTLTLNSKDLQGNLAIFIETWVQTYVKNGMLSLTVVPLVQSLIGTHTIYLELKDQYSIWPLTIEIKVLNTPTYYLKNLMNIGPPQFIVELENGLQILANSKRIIALPEIIDPDRDPFTIWIQKCLGMCSFFSSNKTIVISPTLKNVSPNWYFISIILKDIRIDGVFEKKQEYMLYFKIDSPDYKTQEDNAEGEVEGGKTQTLGQVYPEGNFQQAKLRPIEVNRDSVLTLKIFNCYMPQMLAKMIVGQNSTDVFKLSLKTQQMKHVGYQFLQNQEEDSLLYLSLNFSDQPSRRANILDILQIKVEKNVDYNTSFLGMRLPKGINITVLIPPQLNEVENKVYIGLKKQLSLIATITIILLCIIINFFLSMIAQVIWSFLNDLSVLMSLPLIAIYAPGLAQPIQIFLLKLFQLDLLMTDKWLIPGLFPENDKESDTPLNDCFDVYGYEAKQNIRNSGSSFLFMSILIVEIVILYALQMISSLEIERIKGMYEKYSRYFKWNVVLRFIIQQYPTLLIASVINTYEIRGESLGELMSTAVTFITLASSLFIFLTFHLILQRSSTNSTSYSTLLEGLRQGSSVARKWSMVYLLRWTYIIIILVVLRNHPIAQVHLLNIQQTLIVSLIINSKPYSENLENKISLFNELMISLYLYSLLGLSLFDLGLPIPDEESETYISDENYDIEKGFGWAQLFILSLTICVNLVKAIYMASKNANILKRISLITQRLRRKLIVRGLKWSKSGLSEEKQDAQGSGLPLGAQLKLNSSSVEATFHQHPGTNDQSINQTPIEILDFKPEEDYTPWQILDNDQVFKSNAIDDRVQKQKRRNPQLQLETIKPYVPIEVKLKSFKPLRIEKIEQRFDTGALVYQGAQIKLIQ
ncbi:hypothetical protein FGO68_gene9932 [Halteria grandinella]|uniref:Uncharacterized protein n=1 Tax=Halteria grandinella TaxID=5974 RepID=A0A8J8P7C2_HALGN|nr:hypothetical protein FGO68_gene9932 [Halteria grandinella]